MKWIATISAVLLCGVMALMVYLRLQSEERKPPLPVLGTAPEFSMTSSRQETVDLGQLLGHVWVADFFFTTCAGPCPAMSANMARVHQAFADDDRVRQVSFTVNPEHDTPDVLAAYAKKFRADTSIWKFLCGPAEEVHALSLQGFKIGSPEDVIVHSQRFVLVDREGKIRGYYQGTDEADVNRMMDDMWRLLAGKADAARS